MNIQYLGSSYGGWKIDLDSINDGDTIIDGGLGEDISFDIELLKLKKVRIIGIDPTEKSHRFMEGNTQYGIELIKAAIEKEGIEKVEMFKNSNPNYVSESVNSNHSMSKNESYLAPVVNLKNLISEYNPSLIKLDIEGSEYNVYKDCVGVKQICIEFHHHCINGISISDTNNVIDYLKGNGYEVIASTPNYQEVTFLKK